MKCVYRDLMLWQASQYAALSSVARSLSGLAEECDNCGHDTFAIMLRAMSNTILMEGREVEDFDSHVDRSH